MTLKKFTIFTSIIVGVILSVIVVLSCIKVDGGLKSTPDKVIAYFNQTAGTTCDETNNPGHYNKIVKLYKNMTKLSIFDYMCRGNALDTTAGQDYDDELYPQGWSYTMQQENYCLALVFKEKQTVTVRFNGNTRVIDYYALFMVVSKSPISHQVALFFDKDECYDTSITYEDSPILINANQNALLKYLKYMERTLADSDN